MKRLPFCAISLLVFAGIGKARRRQGAAPTRWFFEGNNLWRGDRAAEGARLESVCWGNSTEGSNPSLSANVSDLAGSEFVGIVKMVETEERGIRTLRPERLREGAGRTVRFASHTTRIPPSPPRFFPRKAHEAVGNRAARSVRELERCQSGRMGRSRKPLTVHAVRGFESHPLRHTVTIDLARLITGES
jgi:hypothetical protein